MMISHTTKLPIWVHLFGIYLRGDAHPWVKRILSPFYVIIRHLSLILTKTTFDDFTKLGANIRLSSKGRIIIGAEHIGNNTRIHHNVTIGGGLGLLNIRKYPTIGNNVWIGPDTIIHGDISIGDGATILRGTVLSRSIPANSVLCGNPPRLLLSNCDNSKLLNCEIFDVNPDNFKTWVTSA